MGNSESQSIMIDANGSAKKRSRWSKRRFSNMHNQKSHDKVSLRSKGNQAITNGSDENCGTDLEAARRCEMILFATNAEGIRNDIPPAFTLEERKLIIRSWAVVELNISQIGLSSYLELFRRAPESLAVFPFLKHLSQEDLEFYSQLRNHSIRVTGVLSMLVKQVEQEEQKANQGIQEFLVDLGRRHFSYGSNTAHMELLGRVFVESLQPVFADDLERENIQKAWISFFRVIVFWLQTGFRFVQTKGSA